MLRGAIVAESLRVGAALDGVPLTVQRIERIDAGVAEQPPQWTLLWFEADDAGRRSTCRAAVKRA